MKKALLLAAAVAALAPTSAVADRPCLQFGWIYNWKPITDRILMVEDYSHRKFRLSLIGTCYNLAYYQSLGFKSRGALSITCIQPGDEVIQRDYGGFGGGGAYGRCAVTHIDYYTPEMEAADRAAAEAKGHRGGY
jgi:hypothetical protein